MGQQQIISLARNIITSGMGARYDVKIMHRVMLLNFISITCIVFIIPLAVVAFYQGNPGLGVMDLVAGLIVFLNLLYLRRSQRHELACFVGIAVTMVLYAYLLATGGVNNTAHVWYFTFPLGASFLLGSKRGAFATLLLLLFAILFFALGLESPYLTLYSKDFIIRFIPAFIVVLVFSYAFEFFREGVEAKLIAKNDALNQSVSELKEMDGKLRKSQQVLEKRVRERTSELSRMNTELQQEIKTREAAERDRRELEAQLARVQKMEAIGTLAGGVAHDLNNVLSGIVSYPELLILELEEDSPLREALRTIQRSGQKASDIVQDLLTLARRGVSTTEVLNLNDIIAEYAYSPEHQKLITYHPRVELRVDLEEDLWNLEGSSIHLRKTLMNLVSNAAEAQPSGGEIVITSRNHGSSALDDPLPDHLEGDLVCLTVADTGSGIAREDVDRIFEPFYTSKKMGRSGTGLGMAVVWGTVEDHRGHIQVESAPGEGTVFKLYLPADRHLAMEIQDSLPMDDYLGMQERILVVDDVEEQRLIASKVLAKLNYEVAAVDSGEAAIRFLKDEKVDLVVLDMIMTPGMDGLTTYKHILDIRPSQKVIIASGFSESGRVQDAQALGAGAYIQKPYSIENIGLAVKNCLEDT